MSEFDKESQALFDATRNAADPTAEDEARIQRALVAKLAATGVVLSATKLSAANSLAAAPAAKAVASATGFAFFAKVIPVAIVAVVGTTWVLTERSAHQHESSNARQSSGEYRQTSTARQKPSVIVPEPAISSSAALEIATKAPDPATPAARASVNSKLASVARSESAEAELTSELSLVTRMHHAWRSGKSAELEALIREHQRRFPRGTLSEEREALRAMSGCRQNPARAKDIAEHFEQRHSASPHQARVRAACADDSSHRVNTPADPSF